MRSPLSASNSSTRRPARAIAASTVVYCILAKFPVVDLVNVYIWTRIATSLLTLLALLTLFLKSFVEWKSRQPGAPEEAAGGREGAA